MFRKCNNAPVYQHFVTLTAQTMGLQKILSIKITTNKQNKRQTWAITINQDSSMTKDIMITITIWYLF